MQRVLPFFLMIVSVVAVTSSLNSAPKCQTALSWLAGVPNPGIPGTCDRSSRIG